MTDEQLIQEFNKGSAKALAAVYEIFHTRLYYFAYRLVKNEAEAEDITIVALNIVLGKHKDFHTLEAIKAYLYLAVKTKCLKSIASQARQKDLQNNLAESQPASQEAYILTEMVRADFMNEIYREVESLSPQKQRVFKLYLEGLSNSEIADRLRMSLEAVRKNKSQAFGELKITFTKKTHLQATAVIVVLQMSRHLL